MSRTARLIVDIEVTDDADLEAVGGALVGLLGGAGHDVEIAGFECCVFYEIESSG